PPAGTAIPRGLPPAFLPPTSPPPRPATGSSTSRPSSTSPPPYSSNRTALMSSPWVAVRLRPWLLGRGSSQRSERDRRERPILRACLLDPAGPPRGGVLDSRQCVAASPSRAT